MLPVSEGWRRLHPLSPLFTTGRYGLLGIYVVLDVTEGESLRTIVRVALAVGFGVSLVVLVYALIAWRMNGFRVDPEQLEQRTGVVFRSHRVVPIARIETVDVARGVIARLFGLADVRVEAVSSGKTEVRLKYLAVSDATALREELVALRDEAHESPYVYSPPDAAREIVRVTLGEILIAYALLPAIWFLAATLPVIAVAFVADAAAGASVAITAGFTAVALLVAQARTVDSLVNFRVLDDGERMHVERGLVRLLSQRLPIERLQSVTMLEPALWRLFGRCRVSIDVAGYRSNERQEQDATQVLLPVGAPPDAERLASRLLPGATIVDADLAPPVSRARWRAPVRWRTFRAATVGAHVVSRAGLLRRRTQVGRFDKAQSVRLSQGPWQRALGLATLEVDTAGKSTIRARHQGVEQAAALARSMREAEPAEVSPDA